MYSPLLSLCSVYSQLGSKEDTMRRWADNFAKLSPACRARLTGAGRRQGA